MCSERFLGCGSVSTSHVLDMLVFAWAQLSVLVGWCLEDMMAL